MWTEEDIWRALRDCYDPELGLNVVELGRVHMVSLQVDDEAPGAGIVGVKPRQQVMATLLGVSEAEGLRGLVENRLLGMEGITRVKVAMLEEPVWTPARISPEGRKRLGLDGVMFPILNNRVNR